MSGYPLAAAAGLLGAGAGAAAKAAGAGWAARWAGGPGWEGWGPLLLPLAVRPLPTARPVPTRCVVEENIAASRSVPVLRRRGVQVLVRLQRLTPAAARSSARR